MKHYPECLAALQQSVLRRLGPIITPWRFYLGGGTALALLLGHRRSVDLDWFTQERIADPLRLAQDLRDAGIPLVTRQVDRGTLHGTVARVRVSWLEYGYPPLEPRQRLSPFQCDLASLPDLAAMKLLAIAQRGAKKDFVDLYTLGKHGISLRQMLAWYQQKFNVQETGHLLYSLSYFEDADGQRMPRLLRPAPWRVIKNAIRQWVCDAAAPP